MFDASREQWRQTWVDSGGLRLQLDGHKQGHRMVLRGAVATPKGKALHEIAWETRSDGRVQQHWRVSTDQGKTWTDAFIGLYARRQGG